LIETLEYEQIKACPDIREVRKLYSQNYFRIKGKFEPRPLKPLDTDLAKAIKKRKLKEEIHEALRKIDCGICGAPTCLAFAEDVVRGDAILTDCIFDLPDNMGELSKELSDLHNESVSVNLNRPNINKSQNKEE
jgi:hypothetical protein